MPQHSDWGTRRQDDRIATNADQTEFSAIRYGSSNPEAGSFDDRIADALDDYEVSDPQTVPRWAKDDIAFESAASDIGLEIRRRKRILAEAYPFEIDGNRLVYNASSTLVYEFCLAVSESPSLSEGQFARLPVAFERLVRDVLVCFLGAGARGFRTGWPGDDHEERPARFKQLMESLHRMTGEWLWSPELGMPDDPAPAHVKDEGLDFVVWKAVPDNRGGKLFLLGQCACGNDYSSKFHDIDDRFIRLSKWLRPISWAWPVRVFSIPRHIPNDSHFEQINRQAGLTLDRARIALLAECAQARDYIQKEAKEPYQDLIRLVIDGFEVGRRVPSQRPGRGAAGPRSRSRGTGASQSRRRTPRVQETPATPRTPSS